MSTSGVILHPTFNAIFSLLYCTFLVSIRYFFKHMAGAFLPQLSIKCHALHHSANCFLVKDLDVSQLDNFLSMSLCTFSKNVHEQNWTILSWRNGFVSSFIGRTIEWCKVLLHEDHSTKDVRHLHRTSRMYFLLFRHFNLTESFQPHQVIGLLMIPADRRQAGVCAIWILGNVYNYRCEMYIQHISEKYEERQKRVFGEVKTCPFHVTFCIEYYIRL